MRFEYTEPLYGITGSTSGSTTTNNTNIKPTTTTQPTTTATPDYSGFDLGNFDLSSLGGFSVSDSGSLLNNGEPIDYGGTGQLGVPEINTAVQPEQTVLPTAPAPAPAQTTAPAPAPAPDYSLQSLSTGGAPAASTTTAPAPTTTQNNPGIVYTGLSYANGDYNDLTRLSDQQLQDILSYGVNAPTKDQRQSILALAKQEVAARSGTYSAPTGNGMSATGGQAGVTQTSAPTATAPETGASPYANATDAANAGAYGDWLQYDTADATPGPGDVLGEVSVIRLAHHGVDFDTQRMWYENGYFGAISPAAYERLYDMPMPANFQQTQYNPDYVQSITSSPVDPTWGGNGVWSGPPAGTDTYVAPPTGVDTSTLPPTNVPIDNGMGTDGGQNTGGTNTGGTGGTNTGGTNTGGTNTGGTNTGGTNTGGTNSGGTGTGGTTDDNPLTGSNGDGGTTFNPGGGTNPNGTNPTVPQGNQNNGTAPNVYQTITDQDGMEAAENTVNDSGRTQGEFVGEQGGAFQAISSDAESMNAMEIERADAAWADENNRSTSLDEMSSEQMNDILSQDSPLMQLARQDGVEIANRQGLRNSSLAAGAQMASMARAASPLALQQAEAENRTGLQNQALESDRRKFNADKLQQNSQFNASSENAATSQEFQTEAQTRWTNADAQTRTALANATFGNDMLNNDRQRELNYNLQQLAGDQDYGKQLLAAQTAVDVANVEGFYKQYISENDTAARMFDSYYQTVQDVYSNEEFSLSEANGRLTQAKNNFEAGMELILGFESFDLSNPSGESTTPDWSTAPAPGDPGYYDWFIDNFQFQIP